MKERERLVIQHLREVAAFSDLYSDGITPGEVKEVLIGLLSPYSLNHKALSRYVIDHMVPDAISLDAISSHTWAMGLFTKALRFHRDALKADREASLEALCDDLEGIRNSLSVYWSQYHLSRELDALELEEFAHEALRTIGAMIEGPMKALLYALVHQVRIRHGRHPTVGQIGSLKLGDVVNELAQEAKSPQQFALKGVRLNQWRNIAHHLTYRVDGDSIVCKYDNGQAEVKVSRSGLHQVLGDVLSGYGALKIANSVVFFDCLDEMRARGMLPRPPAHEPGTREEASLVVLVSSLASQGFEVLEADYTPARSTLVLRDMSTLDPDARRIHTTQFVLPLFDELPADEVVVEYRERDGSPSLRTAATRELIERAKREGDLTIVAQEAQLTDLKNR